VDGVADEILRRLGPWPPASAITDTAVRAPAAVEGCSAILVTGPRAVGTSTVAWQVLMASVASGHRTGFLDVEQLGFLAGAPDDASLATRLANVATCWAGFHAQGAERLVLCGHVDAAEMSAHRDLIPSLRVAALTAAPETLVARADQRRRHKELWLPGDDLYGADDRYVREVALQAATFEPGPADLVIDTDSLTPDQIAARITPYWPSAGTS
jgi:hypothetical protein